MTAPWPFQIRALAPVACGGILWRHGRTSFATIVVKATFGLVPDGNARLIAPLALAREDRAASSVPGTMGALEDASEVAPFLPSAGVLLTGSAHAPAGRPTAALSVRLGVHRGQPLINKIVHVLGPRRDARAQPQPFESMPLVYERAFGGPGVPDNPVGTGAAPGSALPNLLDPQSPERPTAFGPIARAWGPRRRLLGSAPEPPGADVPDGFDLGFFHAAPLDQQVGYLEGNEWIVLDGMHAAYPQMRTRLPDVRAHALWHLAGVAGPGPERRLELHADTLVIRPDVQLCCVVWRGRVNLPLADAARLEATVAIEAIGYPLPAVFAEPTLEPKDREATEKPVESTRPETLKVVVPPARSSQPGPALGSTVEGPVMSPFANPLPFGNAKAAAVVPPARSSQPGPALGSTVEGPVMSPFANPLPWSKGAAGPAPSPEPSSPVPGHAGSPVGVPGHAGLPFRASGAVPPPRARPPGGSSEGADDEEGTGIIDPRALARGATPFAPPSAPGVAPHPAQLAWADDEATTQAATPSPLGAPPSKTLGEALAGKAPPAPIPPSVPGVAPASATPSAPRGAVRDQLLARLKAGEPLVGLALAGADLANLDLSGANLSQLDLSAAKLRGSNLSRARLSGTDLSGADLGEANLTQADLSSAKLANAQLEGALLVDAIFTEAKAPGAVLDGARLARARFASASLEGASLRGASAIGSMWQEAVLDGASFEGADLREASFARASCNGTRFGGAQLAGASFQGATADRALLEEADLTGADLRQARLRNAVLDRAKLGEVSAAKVDLAGASLVHADLRGALLRGAKLGGANLAYANLDGADLRGAELTGANVFGAARQSAKLGAGDHGFVEVDPALARPSPL